MENTKRTIPGLPQDLVDTLPPELAAALGSGGYEAIPIGSGEGLDGLLAMLGEVIGKTSLDGSRDMHRAVDLFQLGCKNLVDVTNFVYPAISAISGGGRDASMAAYNDSITGVIMDQVDALLDIVRVGEVEIRKRATGGQVFGADVLVTAANKTEMIQDRLAPYWDNNAAAAVLSVLIERSILPAMATYRSIANTAAAYLRECREDDPARYESAIMFTDEFGKGTVQALAETKNVREGEAKQKFDKLRDTVPGIFAAKRTDGLTPRDAAIEAIGGESSFGTLIESYPLIDPNTLDSVTDRLNYWWIRLSAMSTFMEETKAEATEAVDKLMVILELGKAHSEQTFKWLYTAISDTMDGFLPEVCDRIEQSLQLDGPDKAIQTAIDDLYESGERAWGLALSALPETAAIRFSGDIYMAEVMALFAKLQGAMRALLDDLKLIMNDDASAFDFGKVAFNQLLDGLPGVLRGILGKQTYESITVSPRAQATQDQYAVAIQSGAEPKAALVGALLTGSLSRLSDKLNKLEAADKPEQLEEGAAKPEQLEEGAAKPEQLEEGAAKPCCGEHAECAGAETPDQTAPVAEE